MNDTITTDVSDTDNIGLDTATDAFLKNWEKTDGERPSDTDELLEDEDETEHDSTDDGDSLSDEDDSDDDANPNDDEEASDEKPKAKIADDEYVTKLKVDGKEIDVSVKDLKRLYGQEAALTRKSQEAADARKRLDEEGAQYYAATEVLLKRAQERYSQFQHVDWNLYATKVPEELYRAVRDEANAAYSDLQQLQSGLENVKTTVLKGREEAKQAQIKQTITEVRREDSRYHIPHLDKVYPEMVSFLQSQGVPDSDINEIVTPHVLKIVHSAYLFEKGKAAQAKQKPVAKAPTRFVKNSNNADTIRQASAPSKNRAMETLRRSGSTDDAADAFLSKWKK